MSKIPISFEGKTFYLDEERWEIENKWREERNREIHKKAVEFFNKIHNETYNRRKLRADSST